MHIDSNLFKFPFKKFLEKRKSVMQVLSGRTVNGVFVRAMSDTVHYKSQSWNIYFRQWKLLIKCYIFALHDGLKDYCEVSISHPLYLYEQSGDNFNEV